jgi:hypothetical protein
VKIIKSLAQNKFDPLVVAALERVFERGDLHFRRTAVVEDTVAAAEVATTGDISVQTTRS